MILSVHVPKTAGSSFRLFLQEALGPRLMWDYGDWPEMRDAQAQAHNERRRVEMLAQVDDIRQKFSVIHGHYLPEKYLTVFPDAPVSAFLRDPFQHALSTYLHAQRRLLELDESKLPPGLRLFRDERMTLTDMLAASPDHQAGYLSAVPLEVMAMIGITEDFDRGVALFQKLFGLRARSSSWRDNVNPDRNGHVYEVSADVRRAVEKYRAGDIELYRLGCERFLAQARRHGV